VIQNAQFVITYFTTRS